MKKSTKTKTSKAPKRTNVLYDSWSILHLLVGVWLGWVTHPAIALAVMIAWEPIENIYLSPIFKEHGILFGYETLRNSLSDIFFDAAGITIGAVVLAHFLDAPFRIF